jgi:tetratricopeptide (TPR) repeat protein
MSANHDQRERLHEEASALYLQGDYGEALATWRKLLDADPADTRAAEGVRLCEGAADEISIGAPATGDDTERTLERLDEVLGHTGADWMDDASVGASAGFQLTDPEAPPSVRVAPVRFDVAPPDSMAIDTPESVRLDLDDLGLSDEDTIVAPGATDMRSTSAAAELEHRAAELMSEAMQCYERGARSEALAALTRLAILDEGNEAARTFAAHIRSEIETEGGGATDPALEQAVPAFAPLPPPVVTEPAVDRPSPSARAASDDAFRAPSTTDEPVLAPGRRVKAKLDVPAPRTMSPRWLAIAAGVIVLALAGFVLLQLGGDDEAQPSSTDGGAPADATQRAALGAPRGNDGPKRAKAGADAAPDAAPGAAAPGAAPTAPSVPAPPAGTSLDQLLSQGRAAFEAGDYKAAILAYNQALAMDSTNGEARERLREAGERFRSAKAVEDSRADAIEAYNRGEYVEALRLFYRVTPESPEDQARITRYLRNGWYNLGIGALRTGDCKTARDHFREAKQHDAEDPGVKHGLSLAAKCSRATMSNEEYEAVRALTPRGLDD